MFTLINRNFGRQRRRHCIVPLALLLGSLSQSALSSDALTLRDLEELDFSPDTSLETEAPGKRLRLDAIRDAALAAGGQHGFASRMNQLKAIFEERATQIEAIFDFSTLMRLASKGEQEMFFLPPVITEASNVKRLTNSGSTVQVSGLYYEITRPAQLTLRAPNWRQYLLFDQELYLSLPPRPLMPKGTEEVSVWRENVRTGWHAGIGQAEEEMSYRIERLAQDFIGMLRYMRLVMSGKIEAPFVAVLKKDVVGDRDTMRLDERVYKISIPAALVNDTSQWNPLYGDDRGSLVYPAESQVIRKQE